MMETAGELGCVELLRLASPPPPTLFSPPAPVVLQKASDLDDDKEVGSKMCESIFNPYKGRVAPTRASKILALPGLA